MKKLLLILLLPTLLFSCKKEDIEPNQPVDIITYTVNIEQSGTFYAKINHNNVPTSTQYTLHTGDYFEVYSGPTGSNQSMKVYIDYQQVYNNYGVNLSYTHQF